MDKRMFSRQVSSPLARRGTDPKFLVALAASILLAASGPVAADEQTAQKTAPAATVPATNAEAEAQAAAAIAAAARQPAKIVLGLANLGWIKRCLDPKKPEVCDVDASFVITDASPPSFAFAADLQSVDATHTLHFVLPLDLQLKPGFDVSFGGPDAYVGSYTLCRRTGCSGEVVLSDAVFDSFMKANTMDVLVRTDEGRAVTLEVPLDGMAKVAAAAASTPTEILARNKEAKEKTQAAFDAYMAKVKAQKAKVAESAKQGPPPGDTPSAESGKGSAESGSAHAN